MFYDEDTPLEDLPEEERKVYYEMFKTLAHLSTAHDLEWAAEWFRQAREEQRQRLTFGGTRGSVLL